MADPCSAHRYRGSVVEVARVGGDGARLDVRVEGKVAPVRPSQFFMVRRGVGLGPLLARPFSLYLRRDGAGGTVLSFLLKVVGSGTRSLASLAPGAPVDLVGPLGRGFPAVRRGERVACVAGGV